MENLSINPAAIEICNILQSAGHQAFIVGGCVRDLILGLVPKDWDITTSAKPIEVMLLFPDTYPTGLQHGTITVAMGQGVENHFEVTTFRVEGKYLDGRRPEEVVFVENIEDDLSRRDLTINAMAYDPIANKLIDPFGGQEDLSNRIIRAVGNAESRFQEDGLRIMRACRFAARFGYEIAAETLNGMKTSINTLNLVSKERIKDELSKTLMTNNMDMGLQALYECGALNIACPILCDNPLYFNYQNTYTGELETRLAYLYSNISINDVKNELTNLKFSNKEIKKTLFLLELKNIFLSIYKLSDAEFKSGYVRFIAKIKNNAIEPWENTYNQFIRLMETLGYNVLSAFNGFEGITVWARKEMNINGDDLIAIGFPAGPGLKMLLDMCYQYILEYPNFNTDDDLISFAQHL